MNAAIFQNIIFARDDGEAVPDFEARVRAAVASVGGGVLAWGTPTALEWVDPANDVGADDEIAVGDSSMA